MASLEGTETADILTGTADSDTARGDSGSDSIGGRGGDDRLLGGEGGDRMFGGAGDDVIWGFGASDRQAGNGDIVATRIATGLPQALFLTSAPGDPDRVFVVRKGGVIEILDPATGETNPDPFLTIPPAQLQTGGEQGLLGLAFHPDYATNGRFFVFLTNAAGNIEVRQYERSAGDPDLADPGSGDLILIIPHPTNANHNGGWIGFGPDGYLYIATGDGGAGGDPNNNAQNIDSLLGKMLRIDVDGDDFAGAGRDYAIPVDNPFAGQAGADEVWATGLRNPWRPSFDRLTGDLYIADVGQERKEEINFQPAGSDGGENYGWVIREGTLVFDPDRPGNLPPDSPLLTHPVIDYGHNTETGGFSVTGGYVYRGTAAGLQGVYLYADFITDRLWSFRIVDGEAVDAAERTAQLVSSGGTVDSIASFGEDGRGNLYIVGLDGEIFLLTPGAGAGDGADHLRGGAGNDRLHGGAQDDTLRGGSERDVLFGDGQDDLLDGGEGRDRLTGGDGADRFDFNAATESGAGTDADLVTDFAIGEDLLDLRTLDARAGTDGNQRFAFVGTGGFSAEGQIRVVQSGDDTIVRINLSGGGGAEMSIRLADTLAGDFREGDFVL